MERDEYFIKMARLASLRGACIRRQVGCILVNDLNHVIATGYNGRARGVDNCLESPCDGGQLDSGLGLEQCEAIHAEANALLQCHDVEEIKIAYCTTAPCIHCVKLLMNTGCDRIVFQDPYPHMDISENLWLASGFMRTWEHFPEQMDFYSENMAEGSALNPRNCKHIRKDGTDAWLDVEVLDTTKKVMCNECGVTKEVCINVT